MKQQNDAGEKYGGQNGDRLRLEEVRILPPAFQSSKLKSVMKTWEICQMAATLKGKESTEFEEYEWRLQ